MTYNYIPFFNDTGNCGDHILQLLNNYERSMCSVDVPLMEGGVSSGDLLLFFILTGGTEKRCMESISERLGLFPGEPVFLLAHPYYNSLAASVEILAKLNQQGHKGRIFYVSDNNYQLVSAQLKKSAEDLYVYRSLRKSMIGLFGEASEWLIASTPDKETVKAVWGPEIIDLSLDGVFNLNGTEDHIKEEMRLLKANAWDIVEPDDSDIYSGLKVYHGFKKAVDEKNISAVSVRCFDLVKNNLSGCFALSRLNDEGIISGCEGDLVSTVCMLWVYYLLEQVPWMANPSEIDEITNQLSLAHCTVPLSIVRDYTLRSHFESGKCLAIQGSFQSGPVTLVRIGGRSMEKIWTAEGAIIDSRSTETHCRTQAKIQLSSRHKVTDLLNTPLGNHLIMVQGAFADRLLEWHKMYIER